MKAFINSTKCSGYGACADHCPSVFEIDEFGFGALVSSVLPNGEIQRGEVPPGDEDKARAAMADCPENAISLRD